jgi:hypothetical protein
LVIFIGNTSNIQDFYNIFTFSDQNSLNFNGADLASLERDLVFCKIIFLSSFWKRKLNFEVEKIVFSKKPLFD